MAAWSFISATDGVTASSLAADAASSFVAATIIIDFAQNKTNCGFTDESPTNFLEDPDGNSMEPCTVAAGAPCSNGSCRCSAAGCIAHLECQGCELFGWSRGLTGG